MTQRSKAVTVGIMGGSASGKTTFAKALAEELSPLSSVILHQDYYFKSWAEYPAEVREKVITANHPNAVCWEILIGHIEQLAAGQPIETPPPGTRASARGGACGRVRAYHAAGRPCRSASEPAPLTVAGPRRVLSLHAFLQARQADVRLCDRRD